MAEGGREGNMQVGDGGISNTVEVRGFSKKTSQELIEMYFENSRRSGGDDVEEVRIRDEVAYITFKEAEVAQRVASRSTHQVDGHTLTVTLFHPLPPKPCYQNKVLIQGVNNAITEELLRNFLETKTKAEVTEFLYGEEDGNVVVTFSDNIDIVQLGKIFQESCIQGVFLKAAKVTISNCILVQNLHPSTSHDVILYYFENKRRSGGGDVEKVEMKTKERYCLIYFEDPSVIDRVLGQSHNVDGVDFEIHLHHECLGRRSSRKKSDLYLRMSSPGNKDNATFEDENTDNQAKDKTSSSVSSNPEKESDFVEVQEWQANDALGAKASLVKSNKNNRPPRDRHHCNQMANFLSNSIKESRSFPASVLPLEKDAMSHTKSSSIPTAETNTDGMMSSEREIKDGDGMFYYPFEKTTIKLVSDNICDIDTDALVSIEDANGLAATGGTIHVEGESNHFKFIDMQLGWVELFQRYGTDVIKDIEKEYNVNIAHGDSGQYHICGEKKDEAATLMKKKVSVKEFKVEEPSACDILASQDGDLFLRETEDTCKCIIKIKDKTNHPLQWENKPFYYDGWCQSHSNKRITLVLGRLCDVEARMVVIPSNRCYYPLKEFGDCFKGENEVMQSCIGRLIDGSQANTMNLWTTFFNDNTGSLPYNIICHAVLFDQENGEEKEHAKKNLKQVYECVLEKAKAADLNSLAIPLCDYGGPSVDDHIYAIKKTIKHYLTKSCCKKTRLDEIVLCITEKKEADLVQKMMADLLSQLEDRPLARLVFDLSRKVKGPTRQRKNRIQVKIKYGQLHEMDANVLVNTTSLDLDLRNGKLSKAILDAAGPEIQEECRKQTSILNLGEFVITGPGRLKTCKLIFHGSLPMWDPTPAKCEQVLKSFVKKCLSDASRRKMKSIAFPSLGTGQLQFPWHQVARAMYESVSEFERENEKTNLEMVMFVIHPKDEMSKEAFIVEEKRQNAIKLLKSEKRSVQQCRNNKETLEGVLRSNRKAVKIMVCEGNMSEEPFDCTLIRMEKCEHGDDTNCPTENVKYCSAAILDSSQLHNEFKIHVRDEEGCLYNVLKHLFDQAMKKRHTVLSFEVNKCFSKMSAGAMVEQFIKALSYQESLEFFLEVHIFFNSALDLANIESRVNTMNIKRSVIFSSLASLTGLEENKFDYVKLRKIAKKICHYPQPPFEVSIQGFSDESCQEAMAKIKKHVSVSEADSLYDNDEMNDDDDDITSVFESSSAEVNHGFLTSCSDTGFLGALTIKTKVHMIEKHGGDFIKGTIDQILLSEKLMFLPDEPEELKIKNDHFQDEANPADLIFPASSDEYLAIIHTLKIAESGITQMKYNEGCIRITCNKNRVSELQGKISSQLNKVRSSHWDKIYLNQGEEITSELPQNNLVTVLYVKEEMKVILFSSSKLQLDLVKRKIMVQLGRLTLTGFSRKQRSLKASVESDSSLFYSPDSRTISSKNTFLTEKGVIIKVYSMSITETNVECIVNATDTQLRNSYGVSKAIADAAGKDFKAACDEHIRLHGPLKRDDVIVFHAGSLKCRCIISIAGPAKLKRNEIYMALRDLENIIVESLKVADGRGFKSIAFPSVCSGLAGFDAELCAQQYYRSVNRFVQQTKSPLNLKEIHFVDIKTSMTQIIQERFTKHFSPQTANFLSSSIKESRSFPASVLPLEKDAKGYSITTAETNTDGMSSERGIKDGMFYYPHEKTTIKLVSENNCDIVTDALVSIEDANGSGNGKIAKALLAAAGSRYQDVEHSKVKMAKRSITEVVVTGSGRLKCEFVLHAIAPEWGIETTRKNQRFRKNVEKTMMNIMDAAFEKKVKCIAVPLIGIFNGMSEVPLTICCEAMIAGLDMWIQSHSQEYQFKEVILICSNALASMCFANLLSANRKEDIKGGRSTRGISLTSSELQTKSNASITSSSNIQSKENCVICMESITDPKVLPKCSHTFCKECIDQQFMYKPACPCCGVVYGKITGSQPNGTMQIFYEKYCLPGFEGCSTIVIFYEFTGGTQKAQHPHPGRPYNGTKRKAYLPNNKRGQLVLKLLREAFNRRLVFTIGTSRTTGLEDMVTWDEIHHKTNRDGGPQKFGYPDPTYLDRVMEELAVKGITEESL